MAKKPKNEVIGGALRPAVSIYRDLGDVLNEQIGIMVRQTIREMKAALESGDIHAAMDASPVSQSRIRLNKLSRKWQKRFDDLADKAVARMIDRTMKNSAVTLNASLRDVSKGFEIDTSSTDARLRQVIQASTEEAAQLIKRIPERFLGDVQGQVMRSITTGRGLQDLVPYLKRKYEDDVRWARNVAMDQMRKAYANINEARLKSVGCEEYQWIHTGGGKHPRALHIALSGKTFRYDDPPVIGRMYGQEVRGNPAQLPFCRCIARPVFRFKADEGK